jgi:hypothetical protein
LARFRRCAAISLTALKLDAKRTGEGFLVQQWQIFSGNGFSGRITSKTLQKPFFLPVKGKNSPVTGFQPENPLPEPGNGKSGRIATNEHESSRTRYGWLAEPSIRFDERCHIELPRTASHRIRLVEISLPGVVCAASIEHSIRLQQERL